MTNALTELQQAANIIYQTMPATPQYCWPLLCQHLGTEVWLKHENHTPVGAFKIRGGIYHFQRLKQQHQSIQGVISATRGNHGQSVAFSASRVNIPTTIVVPHGNSIEKNLAMQALGAQLIEYGDDFQAALEHAEQLKNERSLTMVKSFHPDLVTGVGTYSLEFFQAVADLDKCYVPIGLGSGICGMLKARDALGLKTAIVGIVSQDAPAYARSFEKKQTIVAPALTKIADGMACSTPVPEALSAIYAGVDHIVEVSDQEVRDAMRIIYTHTHNIAEGAGAAAYAAAYQEKVQNEGLKVGVVLTGGNVDADIFREVLSKPQV